MSSILDKNKDYKLSQKEMSRFLLKTSYVIFNNKRYSASNGQVFILKKRTSPQIF